MLEIDFEKIVAETKKVVLSAIQKYLEEENLDYIDDVAQETYLRAYKALKQNKFKKNSELSTWLYTIAKNEAIRMNENVMRQRKKKLKLQESLSKNQKNESVSLFETWEIIIKLPIKYKLIIEKLLEGKTKKEISQELNLKIGTVKSRIFRTKKFFENLDR